MNARAPALCLLLTAAVGACGDGTAPPPSAGASGRAAADHGLSPDWALLALPTGGGPASLRSLAEPGRELWSGTASLPRVERAVSVAPRLVALRGPGGDVHRYDPAEDAVSRLGQLSGRATWHPGEEAGVWVRSSEGGTATLWTLSPEGDQRRAVNRPVRWAAPAAEGATVALLGPGDPATLVRWPGGAGEPDASLDLAAGTPAAVTAWGRTAVLTRTDGTGVVQTVSLTEMEAGDRYEVDGPVTALAASRSSHEIYVAVDDPPRLMIVERFTGEVRPRTRLPRPVRAIRPGVAGGPPVTWDGDAARLVPWDGGDPVRLDSRWRPDLPLALADGSVLVARDGSVERTLAGDGARLSVGPTERLWVPVRWRAETDDPGSAAEPAISGRGGGGAEDSVARDTSATDPGAGSVADTVAADTSRTDTARLEPSLRATEPGFYVVLGWSRSPDGVEERLRPVREAGFPVAAQVRRDDTGDRWYRGLVGPYAQRRRAREVARLLQREHSVEGWVQEVRPGLLTHEVFR